MVNLVKTWRILEKVFPIVHAKADCYPSSDFIDILKQLAKELDEAEISECTFGKLWIDIQNYMRRIITPLFWKEFDVRRLPPCSSQDEADVLMNRKYCAAVETLDDHYQKLIMQVERLNCLIGFSSSNAKPYEEKDVQNTFHSILLSQMPPYFHQVVFGHCSVSFKVFNNLQRKLNAKTKDADTKTNADSMCRACNRATGLCRCLVINATIKDINQVLVRIDLLDRIAGQSMTSLVQKHISEHIKTTCYGVFDQCHLVRLEAWLKDVVLNWLIHTFNDGEMQVDGANDKTASVIEGFKVKLSHFLYEDYAESLIEQFFSIIIDFPDSIPAIDDLKTCMEKIDLRINLIQSLKESLEARILHPGVNTMDILTGYVATIKALRHLDSTGMILEAVTVPIRHYLRKRSDTVRRVVTGLTEEGPTDLSEELAKGEACKENIGSAGNEELNGWETWEPDPFGIDRFNRGHITNMNRSADIISMVVDIYGTKELFMNEYRNLMADRLLTQLDFSPEKEIRNLELLKLRFGENLLHSCEVMLKDVTDSKRINAHIQTDTAYKNEKLFDISALIISAQFWPSFNKESLELPEEIANEFKKFTKSYEAYKGNRTLNWRTVTGRVNIVLEFEKRSVEMTVAPTQAVIIYHFQNKNEWTLEDLSTLIKIPPSVLRRRIAFWQTHNLIREVGSGVYRLIEDDIPDGHFDKDTMKQFVPDDEDVESAMASASDQREEELQVFWSYIVGMLTNLDSLPLERIHQMLKLFASDGIGIEFSQDDLKEFLQRKVREHKLLLSGGVYQLVK